MKNTSLVLVVHDNRILILRRSAWDKDSSFVWCFPGGGVEKGESFVQAASRELYEEANISLPPYRLNHLGTWLYGSQQLHVYIGKAYTFHVKLLDGEHDRYAWIRPNELNRFVHYPNMKVFIGAAFAQGKWPNSQ